MDFGIFLDFALRPGGAPEEAFQESFELVDLADAMGLDTVWFGEMHFNPNRSVLSAPIIVASSIATRTKRLRVGTAVQVLPLIHPPRIASTTEDSFSRVGRLGFPIFLSMRGMDVEDLETNLKDYHEAWRQAGHPGEAGDISVRFPMYIAPTDAEAIEDPKESIEAYFQRMCRIFEEGWGRSGTEYWEGRQKRIERLEKLTYEEILETKMIFGSPARVIDRLAQSKEMPGFTSCTAELNPGRLLPPEAVHRSLKLPTEEVMPAFK